MSFALALTLLRLALAPVVVLLGVTHSAGWTVAVVVATEILTGVVCWLRFRREASYHSLSARLFGVVLLVATLTLFLAGSAALIPIAAAIGVLSHAESVAITLTLAEWRHDVPSLAAARRMRRPATESR